MKIYREITPLNPGDIYTIASYPDATFDYPLHNHPEYEINLVMKASGNRIVGDKMEKYNDFDMVLLGPYLNHAWDGADTDKQKHPKTHTVVLQFGEKLFQHSFLSKRAFQPIRAMLDYSVRGIEFHGKTRTIVMEKMLALVNMEAFEGAINFLSILQILATSNENRFVASAGYSSQIPSPENKRMDQVYEFIMAHYQEKITLHQVASMINMSDSAFSHFFKKSTKRSFSKFLTDARLAHACKQLLETQDSVSEICFQCGYSNLSNFNRLFKKYKGMTPVAYRQQIRYELPVVAKRFV